MASVRGSSARKALTLLSLVFLILFLISILTGLLTDDAGTVLPVSDEYKEIISGRGLIIRDEKVYKNPYSGEIFRVALEGERVPFGAEVANVLSGIDLTNQKNELEEIEKSIDLLQKGNSNNHLDTLSRLQQAVSINDYRTAHNLKDDLVMQLVFLEENQQSSSESIALKLDELKQKRDSLKAVIDRNVKKLYSSHSGIVSFETDGYEEILNPYNLNEFDAEFITDTIIENNADTAFKIVDGFEWLLAVKSSENSLEVGNTYEVLLKVNEDEVYSLKAPLIEIKEDTSGIIYFFRSNILLSELYDVRHADVNIIKLKVSSLKIPKGITQHKEGKIGVFVKEFYGVVRFRPIELVGEDDQFFYVRHGDSYGYIEDDDGKRFKTINIYTEVLLDSDKYSEGEIID